MANKRVAIPIVHVEIVIVEVHVPVWIVYNFLYIYTKSHPFLGGFYFGPVFNGLTRK